MGRNFKVLVRIKRWLKYMLFWLYSRSCFSTFYSFSRLIRRRGFLCLLEVDLSLLLRLAVFFLFLVLARSFSCFGCEAKVICLFFFSFSFIILGLVWGVLCITKCFRF